MKLKGAHLLSTKQLDMEAVGQIMAVADEMQPYATRQKITRVLQGAILGNLFFEPSTRTRISFGAAFNRLGGAVRETAGIDMTSLKKGESWRDTARVVSAYTDIMTIRHPQAAVVAEFAQAATVPVINGGDGTNEHPTQALQDIYTLHKKIGALNSLDGLKIAMVGDLKFGRTVHSLSYLLALFKNIQFCFIAPDALQMPQEIQDYIQQKNHGHIIKTTDNLTDGVTAADIIYMTRIQEERFASPQEFKKFRGQYSLNKKMVAEHCQKNVLIMHPLPRDSRPESNELDKSLDGSPNLIIFHQSDNGLLIRMALFALILGVEKQTHRDVRAVEWHVL